MTNKTNLFLSAGITLVMASAARAAVYFQEDFAGTAGNTIQTYDSNWSAMGTPASVTSSASDVEAPGLSFSTLGVSGNGARITQIRASAAGNSGTGFTSNTSDTLSPLQNGQSAFATALLRLDNLTDLTNAGDDAGEYTKGMVSFSFKGATQPNAGNFAFGFQAGPNDGAPELFVGGNGPTAGTSLGAVSAGTTYMFAIKITSTTNDGAWGSPTVEYALNPTLGGSEPTWTTLGGVATINGGVDITSIGLGVAMPAMWGDTGGDTTVSFLADEVRMASTWAEVTPIPEPSTFALMAGILLLGFVTLRKRLFA